ncbi:MAG TPA: gliding motility-associated ABC transporter substrate-binding protein GldG, partial [Saprospiraceae bacterium]|nr:gliding motility-associated ABC transporter substrate-binding protein GldG [Saprospiraceae bacterium]
EFILNALEYLTNDKNILSARSKELKQRLLNGPKVEQEKSFWQFLNVALPLILLALLGIGNFYYRKNKYIKLT